MTKNLRNLSLNLLIAGICIHAAAAPADTNSLIERIASDAKVPPILVKAIAWQESKWQHLDAPGRIKISSDGGVGIMQIQGGDRNQSEEQNIRAGVAALQIKWQLNISTNARAAVDKLGGVAEDYQSDILENWFVPLAAYNGYSGTGVNGQGGGKGYARAIYSLVRNPTSYQNWRTDGRTEAVSSALLGFFRPNVDITDPKIIPGVDGGTAKNIQAYSLCQLIQNGGKIHRYDFQTQTIVEVTGSVRPKCNISGPQSPVVGLPLLRNVTSGLVPVMPGQAMSFSVTVDNVALVDRVEVFFPDANLAEPAVQNGNIYTRTRIMQRPGENRPFVMRVYPSGSQTPVVAEGRYTVAAVVMTGAVTNPTPASIATPTATPQVVGGQQVVQLVHPLANYPIARILADPRYSGAFNAEHTGIDIMAPVGTAVKAMCAGNIERNRTQRDVGNAVLIVRHTCGSQQLFGYYGHIASDLQANTRVLAGQTLGIVRQNGSNNHHLHFGLQTNFVEVGWGRAPRNTTREAMLAAGWLDPLEYLRNKVV